MDCGKIVLTLCVYDQADVLADHLHWYLDLGVDLIVAQDMGSVDGTRDVLEHFARTGQVTWFTLPERDTAKYNSGNALAALARDKHQADWIILCDADEFLCPHGADLRTILGDAEAAGMTMLSVPCFNMTGPLIKPGQRATEVLTLRIDKTVTETGEQQLSGELPVPYIFIRHPPHTIVRASAFRQYGPGAHYVEGSWGKSGDIGRLRFLHYPIRGYDTFEVKVRNTAAWIADNRHLEPWWGWHWRRWIRLMEAGRLRQDYESQFASPQRANELLRDGTCAIDETVSSWVRRRSAAAEQTWGKKFLARLFG
jgi:hypothetical protein